MENEIDHQHIELSPIESDTKGNGLMAATEAVTTLEIVKDYYGKVLSSKDDLRTSSCCTLEKIPQQVRDVLPLIDKEIIQRFYGCGSPIPYALEGCTVLDLGCGTGRDTYICSKLVGPNGRAIGVDMTEQQLAVATRHIDSQAEKFGYSTPNVEFHQGYIEDLATVGIKDNSVDVIISNCVINLSPNKEQVFSEIFRVLKPGGELYFSDIFAARRIPESLKTDPVLRGECLSGSLYVEDFRRMLREVGCLDYRVVSTRAITLDDPIIQEKLGMVPFASMTIRAFKLDSAEDACEDYGQSVTYLGTIAESPHQFNLDVNHCFVTGKPMMVCGNTASMLSESRYAKHFTLQGDRSTHFGLFDCTGQSSPDSNDSNASCC